jgi:hypothetical protein
LLWSMLAAAALVDAATGLAPASAIRRALLCGCCRPLCRTAACCARAREL